MAKHTITSDEAGKFDPSAQRVTDIGNGAAQTENGSYINPSSIDAAVSRASTEMPEPTKRK